MLSDIIWLYLKFIIVLYFDIVVWLYLKLVIVLYFHNCLRPVHMCLLYDLYYTFLLFYILYYTFYYSIFQYPISIQFAAVHKSYLSIFQPFCTDRWLTGLKRPYR